MNLLAAKEMFLSDLARRSENTRRAYDLGIRQVTDYIDDPEFDTADLSPELVMAAMRKVNVRNVSDNTLASYITGVNVFLKYLVVERLVPFDLIDLENLRDRLSGLVGKNPRRLPYVPTDDTVEAILQAARDVEPTTERLAILRLRDIALLETLRSTGARVSEITGLKCGDLINNEQAAMVNGKGRKDRMVFFDDQAWSDVQLYLALRNDEPATDDQPVFARHDRAATGQVLPMSASSVRNVVYRFSVEAGVSGDMHPHAFRHRLATKVLTATGDLTATQDLLGHSNPATTRIYTRLSTNRLRAAHDAAGA